MSLTQSNRKKYPYRKIVLLILVLLVLGFGAMIVYVGWDNTKLKLTRWWGYFTVQNNPLLPQRDKDLQAIKKSTLSSEPRISLTELLAGGPPKDGIPSIDKPKFDTPKTMPFKEDETVIGVFLNGEARAYPYSILNWHEIVNDKIGNTSITVTLCPLCDTNPVFVRMVNGKETTFGVSGKLYQSCLVMYDRLTDSLWIQPWGMAIAGPLVNQSVPRIPAIKTTLGLWKKKYPDTKILSTNTGHSRDYHYFPYGTYYTDDKIIFPVRNLDKLQVHPKLIESYIWQADNNTPLNQFSGSSYHISHEQMKRLKKQSITFNGKPTLVIWDEQFNTVRFFQGDKEIPSSTAFAFIYPAFFE